VRAAVIDPFGAAADPAMPSLAQALDPAQAQRRLGRGLSRLAGPDGVVELRTIRVTRHKPGRRCVIEYDLDVEGPGRPREAITVIGKVRAGRFGNAGYRLLSAFRESGFGADGPNGVLVPEPIGTVSRFRMWLQRKVPGRVATELLPGPGGEMLAARIAEAAHKVHHAGVPAERRHTMADEVRILRECLARVAEREPQWAGRLARLVEASERVAAGTPEPVPRGIHRDFYADQVLVDGGRLYLIDFDLYCEGDPGLDVGNFLGHVTEYGLRVLGDPGALGHVERAMEERFVELTEGPVRAAVPAYAALTLVRHVYLSTTFPDRRPLTRDLLELCEERLGVARGAHA